MSTKTFAFIAKQWRLRRRLTHRAEHIVSRCSWTLASRAMHFLLCAPGVPQSCTAIPQSCTAILFFFFFFKYLSVYLAVLGLALGMCLCSVAQSCSTLCGPMDYNLPGFSVHGICQARILEWVAISSSREFFWPRNQTYIPCIVSRFFSAEP